MSQWTHEFRFPHATLGFSVGNVDIAADRVSLSFEYLQNVTSRLTAGTQLLYFRAPEMPSQQATIYSLAGRYNCTYFLRKFTFLLPLLHLLTEDSPEALISVLSALFVFMS